MVKHYEKEIAPKLSETPQPNKFICSGYRAAQRFNLQLKEEKQKNRIIPTRFGGSSRKGATPTSPRKLA
jgi:hypothetical protein